MKRWIDAGIGAFLMLFVVLFICAIVPECEDREVRVVMRYTDNMNARTAVEDTESGKRYIIYDWIGNPGDVFVAKYWSLHDP